MGSVDRGFHVRETRFRTTLQVRQLVKTGLKQVTLVSLNLTVLNGGSTQSFVRFHHFVSRRSILILARFGANPNVQIVMQLVGICDIVRIQDNVRIASVEATDGM